MSGSDDKGFDIDGFARQAAVETPEFSANLACAMFGGFSRRDADPRENDPNWLPDEAEIGICMNWTILVLPFKKTLTTESGLDLSAAARFEELSTYCGRIISVGSCAQNRKDMQDDKARLARGQWVIYNKYAGTKFKWRGIELHSLNDDHIRLIINDPADWTFYL